MILTKEIKIKVNSTTNKHYKEYGYEFKCGDEIIVDVNHLTDSSEYKILVKCDVCGEEKELSWNKYLKNISKHNLYTCSNKCSYIKNKKTCLEKYGVENYYNNEKYKATCLERYGVDNYFKTGESKEKSSKNKKEYWTNRLFSDFGVLSINKTDYELKCDCGENHNYIINKDLLHNRKQLKTILCTICNPSKSYFVSGKEIQIQKFINMNYNNNVLYSNRTKIYPNELDIYLPDLKLAFEFNGLYWHDELHKNDDYHLNKTEKCEEKGIQLIHIYEDEWLYKQDIVKSIILNKLGKSNKIYARKCEIKEIFDNKLIRNFLDKNHIQGFIGSKIKIGLFYNNELVSLMTFGNRRVSMGKKTTNVDEYELLRYCNKINNNIIGGASKLFKYFINIYKPNEITTYADRSISQGKLYDTLGFKCNGKTNPNYYYIVDGIKKHRYNFRKDILVKQGYDKNKTEHEIMLERNIYRIYDSGNLKYNYV